MIEQNQQIQTITEQANDLVASLQEQRNAAFDALAKVQTALRAATRQIGQLQREIAELKEPKGD